VRLTQHTDYALRMLIQAALHAPALITVSEVARAFDLSAPHLNKVAQTLAEHGLLQTVRGRRGGLHLVREPETIRIGEVVRVTEPDFQLAPCMGAAGHACTIQRCCDLRHVLEQATKAFLAELDRWTLADMVARRAPMLIAIRRAQDTADAPERRTRRREHDR
jgi:Rrf2 family transcriptional regulator, nitric oxide-sensitive transcriptional repressor